MIPKRIGKINGIFELEPRQRMPYGSSTYCHLEDLGPHVHGSMEFDPVPSHAYNASHHSLGYHSLLQGSVNAHGSS